VPATLSMAAASPTAGGASASPSTAQACSQCGNVLPPESLVPLGGLLVCAACKPLYVQKMREGLPASGLGAPLEFASVWTRLAAKILDGIILGLGAALIIGLAAAVLVPVISKSQGQSAVGVLILGSIVLVVLVGLVWYQIWCLPKYGGTPGKRILNIKVVTEDGGPISMGRSVGRFFAEMVTSLIPLAIGYLIALFDGQKRMVHDHIAGTRVVKR